MKLLILSSNNGGGHNSAAEAIREVYAANGAEVMIRDCMSFLSENVSEFISFSHVLIYRHLPWIFGNSYRKDDKNELFEDNHVAREIINLGKYTLGKLIEEEQFDSVICTHVFGGMMLTGAMDHYGLQLRTGIVETDYCNTPGSVSNRMDLHFLPHESLVQELVDDGLSKDKIVVSGIPVRQELLNCADHETCRESRRRAGECPHILMMGGSMGCGPIPELVECVYEQLGDAVEISVVCGNNSRMEKQLKDASTHRNNVHVLGYVPNMADLYGRADVFVTKAGGISTTEAAAIGLPLVLVNAVAGCEEYNLKFFAEHDAALCGTTEEELAACCRQLIEEEKLHRMVSENLKRLSHPHAAETIYEAMEGYKR